MEERFCWLQWSSIICKPEETPRFDWKTGTEIAKAWKASEVEGSSGFAARDESCEAGFAPDHGEESTLSFK